jgi:predicted transcriptional regulator
MSSSMLSSETISEFLFELANPSRLDILLLISKKETKPSQIARDAEQTIQEVSRHLLRLTKIQLVERNAEGAYALTPLGQAVVALLPEINFLVMNADYFATHDASCIPVELRYGLGLIHEYGVAEHVMQAFQQTECLIREAKERIWIHSDYVLASSLPLIHEALKRGVEFRVILPKELESQMAPIELHADGADHDHSNVLDRSIDSVKLVLVMSERQALLAFPIKDGSPDYLGFTITNSEGLDWCQKLYMHFWDKAEPTS